MTTDTLYNVCYLTYDDTKTAKAFFKELTALRKNRCVVCHRNDFDDREINIEEYGSTNIMFRFEDYHNDIEDITGKTYVDVMKKHCVSGVYITGVWYEDGISEFTNYLCEDGVLELISVGGVKTTVNNIQEFYYCG